MGPYSLHLSCYPASAKKRQLKRDLCLDESPNIYIGGLLPCDKA